jgi:3-hydroxyisobutyrate dehydrogenase
VVERCRPVLSTYGNPVVHLGGVRSGEVASLLNNLLFTANLAIAAGTLEVGQALGLDTDRLGEILSRGTANSLQWAASSRPVGLSSRSRRLPVPGLGRAWD